ncbi:MAG: hypothetical protein J1E62_09400 [Lachnospiraceae bacterium]|nr:hypothetical protein [Lachnospiraceae bacterium]
MNQWLNKMEKKYGKYAIPDLTRYVVGMYCIGAVLGMLDDITFLRLNIYYKWLCLDMNAIFHGQIWRLFTYLLEPYGFYRGMGFVISVLFLVIQVNLFFMFGRSLEQAWGTFRFNLYFFSGYILNIVAALILYLGPLHVPVYYAGFQYIYWAMFFAFAMIRPDVQFLVFFLIPVKVKWLAMLDAIYMAYLVVENTVLGIRYMNDGVNALYGLGCLSQAAAIVVAMANFLIFFFMTRDYRKISPQAVRKRQRQMKKKWDFRSNVHQAEVKRKFSVRHQCAVCGRTQEEFPDLEFRYCSKCEGNYEYCSDHLFTHEHVKK